MQQQGIQLDTETRKQISALAERWGLPKVRHLTPVISRCVERVYLAEFPKEKNMAKVIDKQGKQTPNGRERIMQVRGGAKGRGKQYGPDVVYWPWSNPSCDQADKIVAEIADRHDLELMWDE